eukprot:4185026-Lingulodinium_polyedra.AAC.1
MFIHVKPPPVTIPHPDRASRGRNWTPVWCEGSAGFRRRGPRGPARARMASAGPKLPRTDGGTVHAR